MSKAAARMAQLTARTANLDSIAAGIPGEFTPAEIAQALAAVSRDNFDAVVAVYTRDSGAQRRLQDVVRDGAVGLVPHATLIQVGAQLLAGMVVREAVLTREARGWKEGERAARVGFAVGRWRNEVAAPYANLLRQVQGAAEEGAREMLAALLVD